MTTMLPIFQKFYEMINFHAEYSMKESDNQNFDLKFSRLMARNLPSRSLPIDGPRP